MQSYVAKHYVTVDSSQFRKNKVARHFSVEKISVYFSNDDFQVDEHVNVRKYLRPQTINFNKFYVTKCEKNPFIPGLLFMYHKVSSDLDCSHMPIK